MNSHHGQIHSYEIATRSTLSTPFRTMAIKKTFSQTADDHYQISVTQSLTIQGPTDKAELVVTRLRHRVTYTLRNPRSDSFRPNPPTVEDWFQRPACLGGNQRRNWCHWR
jgi:hypothetical protein